MNMRTQLGLWDSIAIILGIVIGVGIFKTPSMIASQLPSAPLILATWIAGGFITMLGVLCYAELAKLYPQNGTTYVYLKKALGDGFGFIYIWAELLLIRPGSIAAVAFIFAEAFVSVFELNPSTIKLIAIGSVFVFALLNLGGLSYGKVIQNLLVAIVLVIFTGTIFGALLSDKGSFQNFSSDSLNLTSSITQSFILTLVPVLWTYGGWHENTFLAGETENPAHVIPRALIIALILVTFLYLVINFVYIYLIPVREIAESPLVVATVFEILAGNSGKKLTEILMMATCLGTVNGLLITSSRMGMNFLRDWTSASNSGFLLRGSIIVLAALCVLMIGFGTFNTLLFFTGFFVWLFFGLAAISLLIFRKRNAHQNYRAPFFYFTPFLFLFVCIMLCWNTLIAYPLQTLMGGLLIAPAFLIYSILKRKRL